MLQRLILGAAVAVNAIELTPDNWDEKVAGKQVFIKFLAPWWGHCKKMKPDWDKLMKEYKKSDSVLIADVDCTAGGKALCDQNGVRGYPTIKFGDPAALEDYKGGRDLASMKKFASELKPSCSPFNMDLCEGEAKTKLEGLMKLDGKELEEKVKAEQKKIDDAEANFKTEVEKLQKTYEKLNTDKDAAVEKVKADGLGLMKSVQAFNKKANKDKEEL